MRIWFDTDGSTARIMGELGHGSNVVLAEIDSRVNGAGQLEMILYSQDPTLTAILYRGKRSPATQAVNASGMPIAKLVLNV
jgi:hypothetical protein